MCAQKNPNEDIEFEVRFYEGILKNKPDFAEALVALGDLYTKHGFYEKGLEVDKRLAQLKPYDPYAFYNLACSYSLLNDIDNSLKNIKRAIASGYDNFRYLMKDKDLVNLRNDQRFQEYFSKFKKQVN